MSRIRTFSGLYVDPLNLKPEDIRLVDIAWPLANKFRYASQIRQQYTIAQHSVMVSYLVGESDAYAGLLHDAAESYLGDICGPVKPSFPDFIQAENEAMDAIGLALLLEPSDCYQDVNEADILCGDIERAVFHHGLPGVLTDIWKPQRAYEEFIYRFDDLCPKDLDQRVLANLQLGYDS